MEDIFNLDKHQALDALRQGKKVCRENWESDEFLKMKDGQICDEKGAKMHINYMNVHYSGWGIYKRNKNTSK